MSHVSSFDNWSEENVKAFLRQNNFQSTRQLDSGDWVGIQKLMYTFSVCTGVTPTDAYTYRWCFEDLKEAEYFFNNLIEIDDIPSQRTSLKGHRYLHKPLLTEKDNLGFDKW